MTSTPRHTSKALLACLFSSVKSHTSRSLAFSCCLIGWWGKNKRFLNFNKNPLISSLSIKAAPHSLPSRLSDLHGNGLFSPGSDREFHWSQAAGLALGQRARAGGLAQQQGSAGKQLVSAGEARGEPWQWVEGSPRAPQLSGCVGRVDGTGLLAGPLELGSERRFFPARARWWLVQKGRNV